MIPRQNLYHDSTTAYYPIYFPETESLGSSISVSLNKIYVGLLAGSGTAPQKYTFYEEFLDSISNRSSKNIIDFQSVKLEKSNLLKWIGELKNIDSSCYDESGGLVRPAVLKLELLLIERGEALLREMLAQFMIKDVNSQALYSVCDAIGRVTSDSAKSHAVNFLAEMLKHEDSEGRDAATLGLALLEDRRCIPALKTAARKEASAFLRETMEEVIANM